METIMATSPSSSCSSLTRSVHRAHHHPTPPRPLSPPPFIILLFGLKFTTAVTTTWPYFVNILHRILLRLQGLFDYRPFEYAQNNVEIHVPLRLARCTSKAELVIRFNCFQLVSSPFLSHLVLSLLCRIFDRRERENRGRKDVQPRVGRFLTFEWVLYPGG